MSSNTKRSELGEFETRLMRERDLPWFFRESHQACGQSAMSLEGGGGGRTDPHRNKLVTRGLVGGLGPKDNPNAPVTRHRRIRRFLGACTAKQYATLELAFGHQRRLSAAGRSRMGPWPNVAFTVPSGRIAYDFAVDAGVKVEFREWLVEQASDSVTGRVRAETIRAIYEAWLPYAEARRPWDAEQARAAHDDWLEQPDRLPEVDT